MSLFLELRAAFRFLYFALIIIMYLVNATIITFFEHDPILQRRKLTYNSQFYSRWMLKAFNVEIVCNQNIPEDESSLLVGNHIGFIDIVCLHATRNSVFITSMEMKKTPVLGQITDLAGCAYVDRKNRMNIHEELKGIVDVLKQGFRVVLYAESVASNGEQVLPFKKTLMLSAGLAQMPIRPFVFNFRKVNGGPVLYEHRDALCWYGKQGFLPAIWRSLHLDSVVCEIEFLLALHPGPDEDRTELANKVHDMVASQFVPFKPGMNKSEAAQTPSNILSHSL